MAIDPENHYPLYSFALGRDRVVRPDMVQFYQNPFQRDGDSLAAAALFGYLEILNQRLELNESRFSTLQRGQHTDLVERFQDGEYAAGGLRI